MVMASGARLIAGRARSGRHSAQNEIRMARVSDSDGIRSLPVLNGGDAGSRSNQEMNRSLSPISTNPQRGRGVTAVLGPTNTGKTHLAIERMLAHDVGIIGLPLRLLAREVYDKIVARVGAGQVALITGEEKIKPPSPRYYVCTVEAMPLEIEADFVAVDEIQLAADGERGHVFTDRLFHARGLNETLLLGAVTMRDAVRELLPGANLVSRPRLSQLTYAGDKKITRLPRRSAIVGFSANDVYAIAELVRRQRGGAAVVLGALSPRTRNAQVALYQNGEVDFLVATDAIGMGLNLDLDHVAFAGIRKFDGQSHRNLAPAELGQIAGRAGRHMNDGTFGVTGQVAPFDADLVDRLESHTFDQVGVLQWRNRKLDFHSIERLKESLRETPDHRRLSRARMVDDVIALENVSHDPALRDMARGTAAVALLWDMCQIPDYRKISAASHADLVATLYGFVMSEAGKIPADWFAHQVALADRTDGDLDTLSARLAQIRTWTFVSHRADWLDDPEHWQGRTRAIEDNLSDALHERLMQRFVDRRTSVLMRRLRDKEEMAAEIASDGQILVENHYVGRLDGFRFTPDASSEGVHGRAARHAAAKVLASELAERADAFADAPDEAIAFAQNGHIVWNGSIVARLEKGDTALTPRIQLLADEHLAAPDRERLVKRLEARLKTELASKLKPLVVLSEASDISGLARGLAYQLTENLGVLRREAASAEIRALDQASRAQLRKYGVRFGAFNVYMSALLKPAAADLLLLLWLLHAGREHVRETLPARPQQGLTSVEAPKHIPDAYWRAAGFHIAGGRAIRIDMLERLSDLIRARIAFRTVEGVAAPSGATGDGGFRVVPELMSVVGCSGEEFVSILKALGFRRERRPVVLPASAPEQASVDASVEHAPKTAEEQAQLFEEIWRPGKRKDARQRDQRAGQKPRREQRARGPKHQRQALPAKKGRPERSRSIEHSPFAALEVLKGRLAARQPD
jgi:ATP-dependent RNA helicase SUPV3L1/SUV3